MLCTKIKFKNNFTFTRNTNIEEAFSHAVSGKDNGMAGMLKVMPDDSDAEDWFDFFVLCYYMYKNSF